MKDQFGWNQVKGSWNDAKSSSGNWSSVKGSKWTDIKGTKKIKTIGRIEK